MDISVVVPVYGCRAALPELYKRLCETLERLNFDFELIFVNDSCPQNSWELIEGICAKDTRVVGVELSRNFGQIQAILAGLDVSVGDWVVVMDCDLQDRPEEIERLYSKAQEGYDVVFAKRKNRKDSFLKVFVSKMFYKIYEFATDGKYNPEVCNFSICKRMVIDEYCDMRELHRAFVIYIKWLGYRQYELDVEHEDRFEGKSSYNFKKRLNMASEILISQSDKLLKFMVYIGFVITFFSLIGVLYVTYNYFTNHILAGWTSTIVILMLIGGIIIIDVGLVGVYVGKIFMQSKGRPLYISRTLLNVHNHKKDKHDGMS